GVVSQPLLGPISVTDIPVPDLTDELLAAYQHHLRNPSIQIVPLRQIFLLGDVAQPGLYTVPPTTTLAGAVALAGGPSQIGDLNKLRVFRDGELLYDGLRMEEAIHVADIRSGDQIYVGRI